jgi:hypothetical protein
MVNDHRYEELREVCISFALQLDPTSAGTGVIRTTTEVIKDAERFFEWITKGK